MSSSSFQHIKNTSEGGGARGRLERPSFSSQITTDRLREGERRSSSTQPPSNLKPQRKSVFREEGLDDLDHSVYRVPEPALTTISAPRHSAEEGKEEKHGRVTFDEILKDIPPRENAGTSKKYGNAVWLSKISRGSRPMIKSSASAPPGGLPTLARSALIMCLIAVCIPSFQYYGNGKDKVVMGGADASPTMMREREPLEGRQNSQTAVCTRWANQVANVNGTVYIYGGNSKQSSGQTADTWNNDFITLDLRKTWQISSPSLTGLPQPSGPPAVAMGSLWHSRDSLWLYGGYFSDNPQESPLPMSTWKYDIRASSWEEFRAPQTSAGTHSDVGGQPVQRSAEGAGLSVPEIGRSYYFGGHLDMYTTPGWSNQVARVYLKSFLEFTFPGYANTGVHSLGSERAAPREGIYRNITEGGLQDEAGFTERADGALVFIPGWGAEGIILGLAGGTNQSFTEMNIIDVYDVANSIWYKQSTTGKSPPIRVNPCTVVTAAPDGSSFNIYLYGGQNLIPFGEQEQYSDMWILSIPSFTWIQVNLDGQSAPPARAGHSCVLWDAQMVVIGGYVGRDISCDSPGIYVFNTSSLQWQNSFSSISSGSAANAADEAAQGSTIIRSSYGYQVPQAIQNLIGGNSQGGATATTPASGPATAGPIATGKPPTFTVTQSGSTVTQTSYPTPTSKPTTSPAASSSRPSNVGAAAAGTIAAVFALLAAYLAFCTWLYRRQLKVYKNHVAIAQRTNFSNSPDPADWSGSVSGSATGRPTSWEKPRVMLGPFGTQIGGASASASGGGGGGSSSGPDSSSRTPQSVVTPGSRPSAESGYGSGGIYGGGVIPGRGYGAYNDGDGYGYDGHDVLGRPSGSTAHSSTEDLLGGLEPSFFSVVLNPRRTLRVVNND